MSFRDSLAVSVTPLFLRLVLGVTFVWAGAGKLLETMPVQGESAALLANMGALTPVGVNPPEAPTDRAPADPASKDPALKDPAPGDPALADPAPATHPGTPKVSDPLRTPPAPQPDPRPAPGAGSPPALLQTTAAPAAPKAQTAPAPKYSASDFPNPVEVRRVYGLALVIHNAAYPKPDPNGTPGKRLWPAEAARGVWPAALAWAVAITELLGGFCVLVGLFTRLSALGLAGVMAGALWLTVLGPAYQIGKTKLGFLPDHPTFAVEPWKTPLWQFALLGTSLGLFFSGPGSLALDGLFFPRAIKSAKPAKPAGPPAGG